MRTVLDADAILTTRGFTRAVKILHAAEKRPDGMIELFCTGPLTEDAPIEQQGCTFAIQYANCPSCMTHPKVLTTKVLYDFARYCAWDHADLETLGGFSPKGMMDNHGLSIEEMVPSYLRDEVHAEILQWENQRASKT